jgi:tetratricopeptide (TPR) repeat protein
MLWTRRLLVITVLALLAAPAVAASADAGGDALATSYQLQSDNDISGAVKAMKKAVEANPSSYFSRVRLAYLSALANDQAGAIEHYRAAAKLAPAAIEPLLGEQLALVTLGKWDDAETVGKQILAVDPQSYLARSRLAWTRYKKGDFRGSAEMYAAVLVQYPGDVDMRLGLGWSLLGLGRKDDAVAAFREVLSMVPKHAGATAGIAAAAK